MKRQIQLRHALVKGSYHACHNIVGYTKSTLTDHWLDMKVEWSFDERKINKKQNVLTHISLLLCNVQTDIGMYFL